MKLVLLATGMKDSITFNAIQPCSKIGVPTDEQFLPGQYSDRFAITSVCDTTVSDVEQSRFRVLMAELVQMSEDELTADIFTIYCDGAFNETITCVRCCRAEKPCLRAQKH